MEEWADLRKNVAEVLTKIGKVPKSNLCIFICHNKWKIDQDLLNEIELAK